MSWSSSFINSFPISILLQKNILSVFYKTEPLIALKVKFYDLLQLSGPLLKFSILSIPNFLTLVGGVNFLTSSVLYFSSHLGLLLGLISFLWSQNRKSKWCSHRNLETLIGTFFFLTPWSLFNKIYNSATGWEFL